MLKARADDTKKAQAWLTKKTKWFKYLIDIYNQWGAEHEARLQQIKDMEPAARPEGTDELLELQVR